MKDTLGTRTEKKIVKEAKKNPIFNIVTLLLLLSIVVAFILAALQQNWVLLLVLVFIGALLFLPHILEKFANIDIPTGLKVYTVLFIYTTLFLGELQNYYAKYWWWDIMIHISSGLAFGVIGFIILYILYKAGKIKTSPKMIAMFTFAFALAIGALWEIFEFTIDSTLGPISNHSYMQTVVNGCGLVDTMKDLIDDSIGALFSSIMGYLYLKKESGVIVKQVTKEFKRKNPRMFKRKNG